MSLPDFDAMTPDQVSDWVMNNNISELIRTSEPGRPGVLVDDNGDEVERAADPSR